MKRISLPVYKTIRKGLLLTSCFLLAQNALEAQTYYINENFSTASGGTPPSGWSDNIMIAPSSSFIWRFDNPNTRSFSSPVSGNFAIFDSDWLQNFSSTSEDVALESPAFNTTGNSVVKMKWDQEFKSGYGGDIYVQVYDGSSWNTIYNTTSDAYNTQDIDISTYAANKTGVKVRFRWTGWFSWWWIVDNVQVYTPPPCTGTPNPGNIVSSVGSYICSSSTSFMLSLQNAIPGTGVTYQWDSSSNGTNWTAISGATSLTYTGTQSASRYYRCRVTCTNSSKTDTTTPKLISTSFLGCYCIPPGSDCANYGDVISYVGIGTLANNSGCPGPAAYTNYSSTVAAPLLERGKSHSMAVTVGAGGDERVSIWVDENQDGSFGTSEYTYLGSGNGSTVSNSLPIGGTAKIGNTMMRVRMKYSTQYASNEPCTGSTYGETEDYLVTIIPQKPTAVNGQRCGTGNAVCSVSSNTGASSPSFRWYTVATGGTAIAGQTGSSLSSYAITATTTFYVSEMLDGYESPRASVVATVNPLPSATITNVTHQICYNGSDGSAKGNGSGGTSPYAYSWNSSPVQNTQTATGLPSGTFICTVTDSKTCTDTAMVTINNASPSTLPAITTHPTGSTICAGTNTSFSAAATGLNISYKWQVSTGSTFSDITDGGVYSGSGTATLSITGALPNMNGYQYRCVATGTCSPAAVTNPATLTVNTTVPSVTIGASASTICDGTNVTFTATPVNGGSTPVYQWKRNGNNVGTNSSTYNSSNLNNNDIITCRLTSNANCAYPASVTSNSITMTVNPIITPTISIASNAGTSVCDGASVTFSATVTGGGPTPAYQWKVNGNNVGTNSSTYNTSSLSNNDIVTCALTSSVPCPNPAMVTSNGITMTVIPNVTPAVSVSATDSQICPGASVTFTATPTNGGTSPSYQWLVNGNSVGTNSTTYMTSGIANGDVVSCVLTSSVTCVTSQTAASNNVAMVVLPVPVPALTISASPDTVICSGTNVTFSTNPTNPGAQPVYQWFLNGTPMNGATAGIYAASVLNSGDVVSCMMTSDARCAVPKTVTSNSLSFVVNSVMIPAAQISSDKGNEITEGDEVTFSALALNVGAAPSYIWKKNDQVVPDAGGSTYTTDELANDDVITVVVYSSDECSSPDSVISNSITMLVYPTSVSKIGDKIKYLELYPNPNKGQFTVEAEIDEAKPDVTIEVVNNIGQVIYQNEVAMQGNKLKTNVALGDIASGTYMVRVVSGGEVIIKRFVVQQ